MTAKKKIYCRFEGCKHKGFTSRAGRLYHERTKHGRAFTDAEPEPNTPPVTPKQSKTEPVIKPDTGGQFVKVEDVKFVMAKTKLESKDTEECEYECPKCGHEFNGKHKFCQECGMEFKEY